MAASGYKQTTRATAEDKKTKYKSYYAERTVKLFSNLLNSVERNIGEKAKGDRRPPMPEEDLQGFENKPAQRVSPHPEVIMDLMNGILRTIQDSPTSKISFDSHPESSPPASVSPDSEVINDLVSSVLREIQDSPSSETSFDSHSASPISISVSSDSKGQMFSPDSEVAMDLVSSVLREIQDSPSSETSFDSPPASPISISVSSDSKGQMFSPESEVAMDLVSSVLRKIQDSPSGLSLPDISSDESLELQSFYGMDEMLESLKPPVDLCLEGRSSSSASYESSDVTLIDLETSFDSRPTSHSVSPMSSDLDAQGISPTSEAAMDFMSGVLREIEDSPRMTESPSNEYSELRSASEKDREPKHPFANMEEWRSSPACSVSSTINLIDLEMYDYSHPSSSTSLSMSSVSRTQAISPTSEAAMDLVSDVLRRIENSPASDHSLSDHSSLEETAGGQSNNPTGTKKPSMRKQVHAAFSRSWTSVRQIFAFARRSNKIHPL